MLGPLDRYSKGNASGHSLLQRHCKPSAGIQLDYLIKGEISYKPPRRNMAVTPTFVFFVMFRFQTCLIGRHSIATSSTMFGTEIPMKKFLWLMHFGGGVMVRSQNPWTGMQENIATSVLVIPQRITNRPNRLAAILKGLVGNRLL